MGAAFDVIGAPRGRLDNKQVAIIDGAYPRRGFREGILAAFLSEAQAQPDGVFAHLEDRLGFTNRIRP